MAQVERGENTGVFSEEERVALKSVTGREDHCHLGAHRNMEDAASMDKVLPIPGEESESYVIINKALEKRSLSKARKYFVVLMLLLWTAFLITVTVFSMTGKIHTVKHSAHEILLLLACFFVWMVFSFLLYIRYVSYTKTSVSIKRLVFSDERILFENRSDTALNTIEWADIKKVYIEKYTTQGNAQLLLERKDATKLLIHRAEGLLSIDKMKQMCQLKNIEVVFRQYWVAPLNVSLLYLWLIFVLFDFAHNLFVASNP